MNRIVFFISLALFSIGALPQEFDYPRPEHLQTIDQMQVRVQYDVDFRYAHTEANQVMHDKMFTEIGQKVCHSYIEREWNDEVKLGRAYEEKGKRGTNAFSMLLSNIGEVFVGYPKGKNTVICSLDVLGTYKYEEPATKLEWTITSEKFDTLGYHCTMATCSL